MSDTTTLPADLREALERVEAGLAAIGSGDPAPYIELWADDGDVTLFGAWGPIERNHDALAATFAWVGSRFSDGALSSTYEVVATSGDLAFTVGFESGDVRVDGGPTVPMRLRVTHILRRIEGEWRLVHRHADFPPADPRPGDPRAGEA